MSTLLIDSFAVSTIFMSVLVIANTNPIVSVVYLIGVFVLASCYLVCIGLTYVGLTYLVVYVGAVAVLFLFVVMMFNVQSTGVRGLELTKGVPLGVFLASVFILEAMSVLPSVISECTIVLQSLWYVFNDTLLTLVNNFPFSLDVSIMMLEGTGDTSFAYLSQVETLGLTFFAHGALWLIIIGLVLLLAMIGPIVLCLYLRK